MFNTFVLLEAAAAAGTASAGSMFLPLILMFVVLYFLMIRPEKKRKEKTDAMRNAIVLGDEITTIGGMTGKVVQVTEDTITFETGEDRVRIQIKKWGVSTTAKAEAAEAAEKAQGLFGAKKK